MTLIGLDSGFLRTLMILILSLSGEHFPLVAADLGDILQSRCDDDDEPHGS